MQHETEIQPAFKLFAAIFFDGELGGGPLEGLQPVNVAVNLIHFLNAIQGDTYHIDSDVIETLKAHLSNINYISKLQEAAQDSSVIADVILAELATSRDVFFPGGWAARPYGHAMVYRLFYDKDGRVVFLAYNTGDGAQYHKKETQINLSQLTPEKYREKFNPVYAICFSDLDKMAQYGGLQAWIKLLVEPLVLPLQDASYSNNNAEGIYTKIFTASAYLGGEVADPALYYHHITAGQRSGTCAQYAIQKMCREFFKDDTSFDHFILDYRLFVLADYIANNKLPKAYQDAFFSAIANTARMITQGKDLERALTPNEKQSYLTQINIIKKKAVLYFDGLPAVKPSLSPKKSYTHQEVHLPIVTPPNVIFHKAEYIPSKKKPLVLFNQKGGFLDALNALEPESNLKDKRLFVFNIEQLCFTFCERFKDFRSRPFIFEDFTFEEWSRAMLLLHKFSVDYFDHYFKNKDLFYYDKYFPNAEQSAADQFLAEIGYTPDKLSKILSEARDPEVKRWDLVRKHQRNLRSAIDEAASPRQQLIALGLMHLTQYAATMYYASLCSYTEWDRQLKSIDGYLSCMPYWFLQEKMTRDFLLSSTDPDMSRLFINLQEIYQICPVDYQQRDIDTTLKVMLAKHFSLLMKQPYFQGEKLALEQFFRENHDGIASIYDHKHGIPSDFEKALWEHDVIALFFLIIYQSDDNYERNGLVCPEAKRLQKLIHAHQHTELLLYLNTKSIAFGSLASRAEESFRIFNVGSGRIGIATSMTLSNYENLVYFFSQEEDRWAHVVERQKQKLLQFASMRGEVRSLEYDVDLPLKDDVLGEAYDSNEICLDPRKMNTDFKHLRTALSLQPIEVLDYFTRHIHLLEKQDYQWYVLFSLFQPGALDAALLNQGDLLSAMTKLYQRGVMIGDLTQGAMATLTTRGLFLLKLRSWMDGYLLSCALTSAETKSLVEADYASLDEDIQYWATHQQQQPMQTELQRLVFYNIMKRFSPEELSLPQHRQLLVRLVYARIYFEDRTEDRVLGTPTLTEDESFMPLVLKMSAINTQVVAEALMEVLIQLLPDRSPFIVAKKHAPDDLDCIFLDKDGQEITMNLIEGRLNLNNQVLSYIPCKLTVNHLAFQRVIGNETPLAQKITQDHYQFDWKGEQYDFSPGALFKKMDSVWYQYANADCLPEYLRRPNRYVWIHPEGQHALVMERHENEPDKCVYTWQDRRLFSHEPMGEVCLRGAVREKILAFFEQFEDEHLIEVIDLEPDNYSDDPHQYRFYLPRYQLSGSYHYYDGVILTYAAQNYYVSSHVSPLQTGLVLSPTKTSKLTNCISLVPVQAFYTKKEVEGSHYRLIHDTTRQLEQTTKKQRCAAFRYNDLGRLIALKEASTDQLYLVYLYCARFQFERAYTLLQQYIMQGHAEEMQYIEWICEKLPAVLEAQKHTIEPISNSILLSIKLTALNKLAHSKGLPHRLGERDIADCVVEWYTQYYRMRNNLSEEQQVAQADLEYLAYRIGLYLHQKKLALQQDLETLRKVGSPFQIKQKEEELNKVIAQQTQSSLALTDATSSLFATKKDLIHPFVVNRTMGYEEALPIHYWPLKE